MSCCSNCSECPYKVVVSTAALTGGVLVLTLLKIGLSGLTFGILMNYFHKNKVTNVIFALLYAMMSYNIAYSMCLMWLDAVIWLPIIILGIEKIAAGGKPYLHIIRSAFCVNLLHLVHGGHFLVPLRVVRFCARRHSVFA